MVLFLSPSHHHINIHIFLTPTLQNNNPPLLTIMSAPTTTKAWTVEGNTGFDSLTLNPEYAIPALSDNEVLVRIYAGSINYRDAMIPMVTLSLFIYRPSG